MGNFVNPGLLVLRYYLPGLAQCLAGAHHGNWVRVDSGRTVRDLVAGWYARGTLRMTICMRNMLGHLPNQPPAALQVGPLEAKARGEHPEKNPVRSPLRQTITYCWILAAPAADEVLGL